ncbi:hypothetical protein CH275_10115 [Rhodococcus sp. 06-235-1A]|nr:hypothetical protein CH275_10115 [Rhodococcus sp. 06-235-1A]
MYVDDRKNTDDRGITANAAMMNNPGITTNRTLFGSVGICTEPWMRITMETEHVSAPDRSSKSPQLIEEQQNHAST